MRLRREGLKPPIIAVKLHRSESAILNQIRMVESGKIDLGAIPKKKTPPPNASSDDPIPLSQWSDGKCMAFLSPPSDEPTMICGKATLKDSCFCARHYAAPSPRTGSGRTRRIYR